MSNVKPFVWIIADPRSPETPANMSVVEKSAYDQQVKAADELEKMRREEHLARQDAQAKLKIARADHQQTIELLKMRNIQIKIAVEALEQYADDENWTQSAIDYGKKAKEALGSIQDQKEVCICGEINARNCPVHQKAGAE